MSSAVSCQRNMTIRQDADTLRKTHVGVHKSYVGAIFNKKCAQDVLLLVRACATHGLRSHSLNNHCTPFYGVEKHRVIARSAPLTTTHIPLFTIKK